MNFVERLIAENVVEGCYNHATNVEQPTIFSLSYAKNANWIEYSAGVALAVAGGRYASQNRTNWRHPVLTKLIWQRWPRQVQNVRKERNSPYITASKRFPLFPIAHSMKHAIMLLVFLMLS